MIPNLEEYVRFLEALAAAYLQKPTLEHIKTLKEIAGYLSDIWNSIEISMAAASIHPDNLSETIQFYYDLNFVPDGKFKKPYESIYTEKRYDGKVTHRIKKAYEAWNFNPKAIIQDDMLQSNVYWDHAGYELAFMALLASVAPDDPEVSVFISERKWLLQLGEDLINTKEPYHQLLGFLTKEIMNRIILSKIKGTNNEFNRKR